MSKSYGKYKTVGVCRGSNTEYYRERRKHQRHVNNHRVRNVIANSEIDDFDDDFQEYHIPKNDTWDEPTDGHYKMTGKEIKKQTYKHRKNYGVYVTKDNKIKK